MNITDITNCQPKKLHSCFTKEDNMKSALYCKSPGKMQIKITTNYHKPIEWVKLTCTYAFVTGQVKW